MLTNDFFAGLSKATPKEKTPKISRRRLTKSPNWKTLSIRIEVHTQRVRSGKGKSDLERKKNEGVKAQIQESQKVKALALRLFLGPE